MREGGSSAPSNSTTTSCGFTSSRTWARLPCAISSARAKAFLLGKLSDPKLDVGSVSIIYRTLRTLMNAALDDGIIVANPVARLGRTLGLTPTKGAWQD